MIPLKYNIRSLLVRRTTTLAAAGGIALVVFVWSSADMLAHGVKKTLSSSGRSDQAIVMRKGSDAELNSGVDEPNVGLILAQPGVKKDDKGAPIGAGEIVVVITADKIGEVGFANVPIRGLGERSLLLRPDLKIVSGRLPRPGTDEAIVGARLKHRFKGFEDGGVVELRKNRLLKVVGFFEDAGSSYESEVWGDIDMVRSAFGREGIVSSVRVRLESAEKLDAFRAGVEGDKSLGFQALGEKVYYEKQSENVSLFVNALGKTVAVIAALGASLGAMITMYASIANRTREIGTLRALGFSRTSILTAFLIESTFLAALGGAIGALASLSMSSVRFSMVNFATFSEVVFSFEPTPGIIGSAVLFACVLGVLGGLLPAWRAARTSPVQAMRG